VRGSSPRPFATTALSQQADVIPVVDEHKDFASGTINDKVTAFGLARIRGQFLSFDDGDPTQGVFWTEEGSPLDRFRHTAVLENTDIQLRVDIPFQIVDGNLYICSVVNIVDGEYKEGFLEHLLFGVAVK